MFETVGFIGTGNMGTAVSEAVIKSGLCRKLYLANRTAEKAELLAEKLRQEAKEPVEITVCSNREAAEKSSLLFLCVKPHIMPGVLEEIREVLAARKDRFVLCTMAAALTCEKIQALSGKDYPVIRIMPNTPASVGKGVTEYCVSGVTEEEKEYFLKMLAPSGILDELDEKLIDAASAVSGCGPAFAYMFAEALADGGVACGLPRKTAELYAAGMLSGAAEMLLESGKHAGALKDAVCSPGGATIQGVRTLEENGFRGAVMDAVIAAYEKTVKMK